MVSGWSYLNVDDFDNLDVLRKVAPEAVQGILGSCEIRTLEAGELLISSGTASNELYLILEGKISVLFSDGEDIDPIILEVGQTVGELSVIDNRPASATVKAIYYTRVLVVTEDKFWRMIDVSHQFAKNMLVLLSERMRTDNTLLKESIIMKNMFEEQTILDPLTSLHNRRWIDLNLAKLIRRARFGSEPFSIMMLDVDFFKKVNDEYGHLQGDIVLRMVAEVIQRSIRPHDIACRYGGEEFLVIFPNTSLEDALVPAERIRRSIQKHSTLESENKELPVVTITGGVTSLSIFDNGIDDSAIMDLLIAEADDKLYVGKTNGRNRIIS